MKPIRTCLVCKNKFEKQTLHRIVKVEDSLQLDSKHLFQSRAVYICKNEDCQNKMWKQKVFNRAFKTPFEQNVYESILNAVKEGN